MPFFDARHLCMTHHCSWIAAVTLLAGCTQTAPEEQAHAPVVTAITLAPAPLELFDNLSGRVAPLRSAEIRAQVGGIVQRRLFEQGADVAAGQTLFQINAAPFKAEADVAAASLQRMESALKRARTQAERLAPLAQADAISRQDYDDAVAQRDQAAADAAQARATLSRRKLDVAFATVSAPISGRIEQTLVTEGALVAPTDTSPMARIQQIDKVYVDLRRPAASYEALRDALAAHGEQADDTLPIALLRSNGTAYRASGRVLFSGATVDPGTGDVLLRVLVDNPELELLPGMFVQARVPRERYSHALTVPQQAVLRIDGQPHVWTLDADNKAHLTGVTLGQQTKGRYHVQAGLIAGQRIVVEGMERLAEGARVHPRAARRVAKFTLPAVR